MEKANNRPPSISGMKFVGAKTKEIKPTTKKHLSKKREKKTSDDKMFSEEDDSKRSPKSKPGRPKVHKTSEQLEDERKIRNKKARKHYDENLRSPHTRKTGRPPTYKTDEERDNAKKESKRKWYRQNRAKINNIAASISKCSCGVVTESQRQFLKNVGTV